MIQLRGEKSFAVSSVMFRNRWLIITRQPDGLQLSSEIDDQKSQPVLLPLDAVEKLYTKNIDPGEFASCGLQFCHFETPSYLEINFSPEKRDATHISAQSSDIDDALMLLFPEGFDGVNFVRPIVEADGAKQRSLP